MEMSLIRVLLLAVLIYQMELMREIERFSFLRFRPLQVQMICIPVAARCTIVPIYNCVHAIIARPILMPVNVLCKHLNKLGSVQPLQHREQSSPDPSTNQSLMRPPSCLDSSQECLQFVAPV